MAGQGSTGGRSAYARAIGGASDQIASAQDALTEALGEALHAGVAPPADRFALDVALRGVVTAHYVAEVLAHGHSFPYGISEIELPEEAMTFAEAYAAESTEEAGFSAGVAAVALARSRRA